ncbi:unnamed protein product [Lactuca saligna]|uniref:TIR domain-containing protein n=1 Tax=Lactuca saligna TaxID=75948 RepID=A0AA36A5H0_LACSI|nr:unnamed protein product [Lactuca saligna]
MASTSTSSVHKSFKYDLFLSFRGQDTRKNFVDHLYYALKQKGIYTYKDGARIKKGVKISDELIGSIEDSKFYIIVFSKNYASSSWCLDELVKIMECHQMTEHTAYPIFYDVEPSEVRKQSGAVGEAFAKHENAEAAGKWRVALKEAADLAGWELKQTADGHEAKFIQKIVEKVSLELRSINFGINEKLVGMESRIKEVISSLGTGFDDARMIGIKGMGGGGKTTLAMAVFDQISLWFEGKSFVENVREVSKASLSGLMSLQNQILSDVLNDQAIRVSSVYDGKNMLKRMFPCKKVLVVLDDVDHRDQLEVLAGDPNWFKPGSTIIITTRDEQLLVAHGVKLIHNVSLLLDKEAICLFSRYAFGREIPIQRYEELAQKVVSYAVGLPLTITVLGSSLCGQTELQWIDVLKRLKTIPLEETLKKLELSYICLEEDHKEMFLDVACILKGRHIDYAITALESCGFHARYGLRVLEQKSLITISHDKFLGMHDHIEEMGRNIVRRSHPGEPRKHSRLWIEHEIEDILANNLGTNATRCLQFNQLKFNPEIVMKGLRKMKELRFLDVTLGHEFICSSKTDSFGFNSESKRVNPYFPNALQYLHCRNYPFRSLPKTFEANNLVTLIMIHSDSVQLWKGSETKVKKLKFLYLSHSKLQTLDLGITPNLEELTLNGCGHLIELHMPIECLKLISLNIYDSKLRTLDLRMAPNLEKLVLDECDNLVQLLMPKRCLSLTSLTLTNLKLRTLDIGTTPNLEFLELRSCYDLEELHMADECRKLASLDISYSKLRALDLGCALNLKKLALVECDDLGELQFTGRCLNLTSLKLINLKLRTLDLRLTPNLEDIVLENVYNLEEFHMADEGQKLSSFNISHSKVRTLDLGRVLNLEKLIVFKCGNLVELHITNECQKLASLDISYSKLRTLDLGLAPNLVNLALVGCSDFGELHMPIECSNLRALCIHDSKLRILDLGLAPNLEKLVLRGCNDLVQLHMHYKCLNLTSLKLSSLKLRTLDIGMTPNLKVLELSNCYDLEELHIPYVCEKLASLDVRHSKLRTLNLGQTLNLKSLCLNGCGHFKELPEDLGRLVCLEKLILRGCRLLRYIPNNICKMKCLKVLDISGTYISHLPQSIILLKELQIIGSRELLESFGFTSKIQTINKGSME